MEQGFPLEPAIAALRERGAPIIEAVKAVREVTGLSLAEAKQLVTDSRAGVSRAVTTNAEFRYYDGSSASNSLLTRRSSGGRVITLIMIPMKSEVSRPQISGSNPASS